MSVFHYTNYYQANSSAVSELYYDGYSNKLIVVTHNGTHAGYTGVDPDTYEHMVVADRSQTGSLGRFWNHMIKGNFSGFDTSDIHAYTRRTENEYGVDEGSVPEDTEPDAELNQYIVALDASLDQDE